MFFVFVKCNRNLVCNHFLFPAKMYLFKVNNRITRKIYSKLTKTPERRLSSVYVKLTLNLFHTLFSNLMIVDFQQKNLATQGFLWYDAELCMQERILSLERKRKDFVRQVND